MRLNVVVISYITTKPIKEARGEAETLAATLNRDPDKRHAGVDRCDKARVVV